MLGRKIDGKYLSEWSKESGVPVNVIYERIYARGWDVKRAIFQPVKNAKIKVVYNGKEYDSISKLSKEVGIKPKTLRARLRSGMSVEEAVSQKRIRRKQQNRDDPYGSTLCPHKDCFTCPYYDCIYGD